MEAAAELAGFFAAHGIWCVSDGGPLIPMLAFEKSDGKRQLVRLAVDDLGKAARMGQQWLDENREGALRAVLVCDGFITLPSGKTDALILEARSYGPPVQSFRMAVPYRNREGPSGFAVHRPKFLGFEGGEPDQDELAAAFFRGVDRHEEGARVWNAHLDQSQ